MNKDKVEEILDIKEVFSTSCKGVLSMLESIKLTWSCL
jgi:hypothetical protein